MPVIRAEIKALLIGAFWIVFALGLFRQWPLPFLQTLFVGLAWLLLVLLAAGGYGQIIARRCLPRDVRPLEFILFSIVIGYGLLSFAMTVAGTVRLWTPMAVRGLVLGGLVLQVCMPRPFLALRRESIPFWPACLLVLFGVVSVLITATPITYYDSLVYHMAMPAVYVQAGHWVPLLSLMYSAFPQNMEMLSTIGLLLSNDTLANLIGWSIAATTVGGVCAFASRYVDSRSGWYAAALLASMPAFILLSSGGYVDVAVTCFSFFSLYAIFLWRDGENHKCLALAGALAGWAVGCKYTGGIPVALGALLVCWHLRRRPREMAIGLLIYGGVAALCFAPWLIKNFVYFGNPVFPFFRSIGIAQRDPWMGGAAEGYFHGLIEYQSHKPWELLSLVWLVATRGLDFGRGMDVLGDIGWAPLVGLLPLLWVLPKRRIFRPLGAFAFLFFAAWGMTRPVLRFLLPIAPLSAVMAGYAWSESRFDDRRNLSFATRGIVLLLLTCSITQFFQTASLLSLFSVPLGLESRENYLRKRVPYYGAAEFINGLPDVQRVFLIGDQRGYYYNKPVMITPIFNRNPLVDWAETCKTPEELHALLLAKGISHLVVTDREAARLEMYHPFPFKEDGRRRWELLRSQLRSLYKDNAAEVYAL